MNVRSLSNLELMARFGKLVQTERKITHLVLECIAEIETRKIYLERAYPSLYEFLVKEFGYSSSAAIRRIESARLLREVPEMSEKIESGALNLSQLSKVQQAIRTVQKIEDRKLEIAEKRDLLRKIEYTTQNQTELILALELSLPIVHEEREKVHRDESVTLTITFTKEQMALLEKVQDLIAHSVPEKKWAEIMTYLAQKEVERKTQIKRSANVSRRSLQTAKATIDPATGSLSYSSNKSSQSATEELLNSSIFGLPKASLDSSLKHSSERKSIRLNLRKSILEQEKCCGYQDPVTKKICGSTRFLQLDHIQPVWAGGDNSPSNLRVLCAQHNNLKYAKESGLYLLRR